jgi:predicted negative regulator of RcsB-dependent stress response
MVYKNQGRAHRAPLVGGQIAVARTKMTRHELKEQDEITTSLQKFTETAYERKREIIVGIVAVVVIVLAIAGWRIYSANRNARAQNDLAVAINAFNDPNIKSDKERFEKTLAAAQKVHDDYRSLSAGAIAQYFMALSQEGLGDTAKAQENLQQVVRNSDENVAGVAKFALAGIYKTHGETQKALDLYKQIYDNGGYSKSAAIFEMAKLQEANNRPEEAKAFYQKIVSEFPESPFRQDADQALKRLGAPATEQKPS